MHRFWSWKQPDVHICKHQNQVLSLICHVVFLQYTERDWWALFIKMGFQIQSDWLSCPPRPFDLGCPRVNPKLWLAALFWDVSPHFVHTDSRTNNHYYLLSWHTQIRNSSKAVPIQKWTFTCVEILAVVFLSYIFFSCPSVKYIVGNSVFYVFPKQREHFPVPMVQAKS